jgi:hypothetical protein
MDEAGSHFLQFHQNESIMAALSFAAEAAMDTTAAPSTRQVLPFSAVAVAGPDFDKRAVCAKPPAGLLNSSLCQGGLSDAACRNTNDVHVDYVGADA